LKLSFAPEMLAVQYGTVEPRPTVPAYHHFHGRTLLPGASLHASGVWRLTGPKQVKENSEAEEGKVQRWEQATA